jgi:serine/threonine protein phosphatase PrpC
VAAMDKLVSACLKSVFLQTDKDFLSSSAHTQHGSTATTALLLGKRLYCANVGDSRTMLCRNFQPILLSEDHKPTREDESKRIREAGGFVINNRVMGELAVSRAFGDVDFKKGIQSILEEEEEDDEDEEEEKEGRRSGRTGRQRNKAKTRNNKNNKSEDNSQWDQPLIIAEPDLQVMTINENDQFLLLACDGLFDVYTPSEIVKFVTEAMERHGDTQVRN